MSSGSARNWLVVAIVSVLAAFAALSFAWWLQTGAIAAPGPAGVDAPAPAVADVLPAVAPALSPLSTAPETAAAAPLSRTAVSRTRVAGVVVSGSGAPLAGWHVRLWSNKRRESLPGQVISDERVRAFRHAYTAADGGFAFEDLEAGDYGIDAADTGVPALAFSLALHEDRWIELRGAGGCVQVQLLRFGSPLPRGRVALAMAGGVTELTADDAGFARCLLAPGACEVRVLNETWPVGPTSVHTRMVPADAVASWQLETGGIDLQVDAAYADGTPCAQFAVQLDGTLATGERGVRAFVGSRGTARIDRVPPGRWQVAVSAADLAPSPAREVVLDNRTPNEHLAFVVRPGATVTLTLRGTDVSEFVADPQRLPWLISDDVALRCTQLPGKSEKWRFGYVGVSPGIARLVVEDRVGRTEIEFLPFDPHAPQSVDVQVGRDNEAALDVVKRARVELRACEVGGREDVGARVAVYAGERSVVGVDARTPHRWCAWLPPGDYRVVVDRKGTPTEHALHVERADVTLRLRP